MKTFLDFYEDKTNSTTGDLEEACWSGYKKVGTKKKNGKNVPNCVPEEAEVQTENLKTWFDQKWVRMDTKGNIKGDCAREEGEGKPKCLPLAKARAMPKAARAKAARRKRREDPVADRSGKGNKPINVATEAANPAQQAAIAIAKKKATNEELQHLEEKNSPTNPTLWSKAKSLARQKFDVYPSAYANGWASKWYKSKGGGWKSVSEDVETVLEKEGEDYIFGNSQKPTAYSDVNPSVGSATSKKLYNTDQANPNSRPKNKKPLNKVVQPPKITNSPNQQEMPRTHNDLDRKHPMVPKKPVVEEVLNERGADSKGYKRPTEQGAGLTAKGAKHFGVQTAVTGKVKAGSKAAKRRKSFCARMSGMKGPMKDEKGRPTRKAMSLRRWRCR